MRVVHLTTVQADRLLVKYVNEGADALMMTPGEVSRDARELGLVPADAMVDLDAASTLLHRVSQVQNGGGSF